MFRTIKLILTLSLVANFLFILLILQEKIRVDIKNIIKDTFHTNNIGIDKLKKLNILDNNISINGLAFLESKSILTRLPKEIKNNIRPVLWELGQHLSGARIRFKTNSNTITIIAKTSSLESKIMTSIMKNGVDIYINNMYSGSAWANSNGEIKKSFYIGKNKLKNITIYLPLYSSIKIKGLFVDKNASILKANDLNTTPPIVYYGSSITQGASASNPGLSYEAIISRRNHIDFINLGFSGNGLGDTSIASFISTIDSSLIVLDYCANLKLQEYKQSLPLFVNTIRKIKKDVPILIISPFFSLGGEKEQIKKKLIIREFIAYKNSLGDQHIYMLDGTKMLSKEHSFGLVDGIHLNSLGFWFAANSLETIISKIINK